jgi:hypothetical protein
LTAISVAAANEHDGHHAGALVDQQPERRRPRRLIGDTAYGNVEAREVLEQRSVSVLAPVHSTSPKDGTIPKEAFAIDLETDTVTCPQGKTAPIYKPRPNRKRPIRRSAIGERVAKFSRSDCEPCPLRQRCSPSGQRDIRSDAATISSAPGRESSGCSDSSSTATEGARAATSGPENRGSRPFGPPSSSTSTQSEPPCGPRLHSKSRSQITPPAADRPASGRATRATTLFSVVSPRCGSGICRPKVERCRHAALWRSRGPSLALRHLDTLFGRMTLIVDAAPGPGVFIAAAPPPRRRGPRRAPRSTGPV